MPEISPLVEQAYTRPNRPAIIVGHNIVTYSELKIKVEKTLGFLQQEQIKPGYKVAFLAKNRFEEIILLLSLYYNKTVTIPLSFRYTDDQFLQVINQLSPDVIINFNDDSISCSRRIDFDFEFIDKCNQSPLTSWDLTKDAGIVLSSGSTGQPKAVVQTLGNYYWSALGANAILNLEHGDRYLLSLPLFHVGGLGILFRTLLSGATLVLPDEKLSLTENIVKFKISHLSLVSTQLKELVESIDDKIADQLKAVLLGGSAFPDTLIEKALQKNIPIIKSYGATESASLVTATRLGDGFDKLKTSGTVLPYRKIKISADGEILISGEVLFDRYLNDTHANTADYWYPTGDLGFIDSDGYLTVAGRKDNLFISGGENIYPEEIEATLLNFPEIEEAVVVPLADEKYGFVPVAFVRSNREFDQNRMWSLEKFKKPKKIYPWPADYKKTGLKINRLYFIKLAQKLNS